jgi:hypothetical protein
MQLMPGTARDLEVGDRYNPEQNIRGGIAYLRQMLDLFAGRLELAIAAYNAGPAAVQKYNGIPPYPDTRDYVDRVLTLYRGGSSLLLGFAGSGVAPAANGLTQALYPSRLQQALRSGELHPGGTAPRNVPPAAPPIVMASSAGVLPAAPAAAPVPAVGAAMRTAPAEGALPTLHAAPETPAVVPASLPVAVGPATAQPSTGG